MINNFVNSTLNQCSFALSDAQDQMLNTAKKRAEEEKMARVPSPSDFKQELESLAKGSPEDLQKAEQIYNKTVSSIEKAIQKLEALKAELQSIKDKLKGINEKFETLLNFIGPGSVIAELMDLLEGLLPTLDGILATQVTPVVSGTVVGKIIEFKKDFKDKIKNVTGTINSLPEPIEYFNEEIGILERPIDSGISKIQVAIDRLNLLLDQIIALWSSFILGLNIPEFDGLDRDGNTSDSGSPLDNTTLEEYILDPENLRDIITTVVLPTKKVRYEVREDGPGTRLFESSIQEVPINQNN